MTTTRRSFRIFLAVLDILLSGADIGMPGPLLNLFDFGTVFEGIVEGSLAKTVRADTTSSKARHIEPDR